jgi:hypothetical protein
VDLNLAYLIGGLPLSLFFSEKPLFNWPPSHCLKISLDCIILPDRELGDLQWNISKILQNKIVEDYKNDPALRVTPTLTEGQTISLASGR